MRVLVACEFSGIVRDAFIVRGHDAVSCDLLPTERPGPHIQGDVRETLAGGWDMMLAFPPCTYLAHSGNRWHAGSQARLDALAFVRDLMAAPIPRWAIENPRGVIGSAIRRPDMVLQPWEYGHPESKATCLWLKGLPPLMVTAVMGGPRPSRILNMPGPRADRATNRSRTYEGVAAAMAEQWGHYA